MRTCNLMTCGIVRGGHGGPPLHVSYVAKKRAAPTCVVHVAKKRGDYWRALTT